MPWPVKLKLSFENATSQTQQPSFKMSHINCLFTL